MQQKAAHQMLQQLQAQNHQRTMSPAQIAASDRELLDRVKKQWRPELSILNYFTVEVAPPAPLTPELIRYPSRSRYYETFLCTWTFAFSILLIHCLEYLLANRNQFRKWFTDKSRATALQFCLLSVPFQICVLDFPVKKYINFVLPFNAACLLLYLGCLLHKIWWTGGGKPLPNPDRSIEDPPVPVKHQFNDLLSIYRSIVYISTAVCIFARDQPCWNNDFSKTYSFGTGLMDVGIGCFIVCVGSLGPTAVRRAETVDRSQAMTKAIVQSAILSACGLVKTFIVTGIAWARGIQFDNSWREYGVHWNAFYSLAVARLLGTCLEMLLLRLPFSRVSALGAALALAAAHEAALSGCGLAEWVLAPGRQEPYNRTSLLGQNREGLASIPGILTLYLLGLQLGRWTRAWAIDGSGALGSLAFRVAGLLCAALAVRPLVVASGGDVILPESRRLLSPSYTAWVLAFSCFCLLAAGLVICARRSLLQRDESSAMRETPLHLKQIDSSGLLYFLVSNLLTGIFNWCLSFAIPNRELTDGPACFIIVLVYTAAVFWITRRAENVVNFRTLQEVILNVFRRYNK